VKRAIIGLTLVIAAAAISGGQNRRTFVSTARSSSEWRDRIDLGRQLSDSAALDKFVIIYRPTYRQTLFVFARGRLVLQTYPPQSFPRSTSLLPTCTADASRTDITDTIRTMIQANFFDLPQQSFVDTGEYSSDVEFEKQLKAHYIIVDDGSRRAYRAFAEGTYQGGKQKIPAAFANVEARLIRLVETAASRQPCPMAHYMEWRSMGRGETLE
jgi:hypothetical protein